MRLPMQKQHQSGLMGRLAAVVAQEHVRPTQMQMPRLLGRPLEEPASAVPIPAEVGPLAFAPA